MIPIRARQAVAQPQQQTPDINTKQAEVPSDQMKRWKAQLEEGAAEVFGPGGGNGAGQPAVDVKSLHAKIGELTLENDFWKERSAKQVC